MVICGIYIYIETTAAGSVATFNATQRIALNVVIYSWYIGDSIYYKILLSVFHTVAEKKLKKLF